MQNNSGNRKIRFTGYLTAIVSLLVFYLLVYLGFLNVERRHQDFQMQMFSREASRILEQMVLYADA